MSMMVSPSPSPSTIRGLPARSFFGRSGAELSPASIAEDRELIVSFGRIYEQRVGGNIAIRASLIAAHSSIGGTVLTKGVIEEEALRRKSNGE